MTDAALVFGMWLIDITKGAHLKCVSCGRWFWPDDPGDLECIICWELGRVWG